MNLEQIDTSTTAGKARVMQLAAEGRKVAGKSRANGDYWQPVVIPSWNWVEADFAIIAEPVGPDELWVEVCDRGIARSLSEEGVARKGHVAVRYIRADLAGEGK